MAIATAANLSFSDKTLNMEVSSLLKHFIYFCLYNLPLIKLVYCLDYPKRQAAGSKLQTMTIDFESISAKSQTCLDVGIS